MMTFGGPKLWRVVAVRLDIHMTIAENRRLVVFGLSGASVTVRAVSGLGHLAKIRSVPAPNVPNWGPNWGHKTWYQLVSKSAGRAPSAWINAGSKFLLKSRVGSTQKRSKDHRFGSRRTIQSWILDAVRHVHPNHTSDPALESRVIEIEKGVVRLLAVKVRLERLLGEAAERPGIEIGLADVKQMELGLVTQRQSDTALPNKHRRGQKSKPAPVKPTTEAEFTTLDPLHRAMLLFGLGRSTLLRQVLETELRQSKRFERLALSLNALYPDGSDERRMLEGVQAAMRGIR